MKHIVYLVSARLPGWEILVNYQTGGHNFCEGRKLFFPPRWRDLRRPGSEQRCSQYAEWLALFMDDFDLEVVSVLSPYSGKSQKLGKCDMRGSKNVSWSGMIFGVRVSRQVQKEMVQQMCF